MNAIEWLGWAAYAMASVGFASGLAASAQERYKNNSYAGLLLWGLLVGLFWPFFAGLILLRLGVNLAEGRKPL